MGVLLRAVKTHDLLFSIFFFQAEDGIRDLIVTGVQTCALPIYLPSMLLKPLISSIASSYSRLSLMISVRPFFDVGMESSTLLTRYLMDVSPSNLEIGRASCRERV